MPQFTKSDPGIRRELRKVFGGSGRVVGNTDIATPLLETSVLPVTRPEHTRIEIVHP
jgi:hypothetical protein